MDSSPSFLLVLECLKEALQVKSPLVFLVVVSLASILPVLRKGTFLNLIIYTAFNSRHVPTRKAFTLKHYKSDDMYK